MGDLGDGCSTSAASKSFLLKVEHLCHWKGIAEYIFYQKGKKKLAETVKKGNVLSPKWFRRTEKRRDIFQ